MVTDDKDPRGDQAGHEGPVELDHHVLVSGLQEASRKGWTVPLHLRRGGHVVGTPTVAGVLVVQVRVSGDRREEPVLVETVPYADIVGFDVRTKS